MSVKAVTTVSIVRSSPALLQLIEREHATGAAGATGPGGSFLALLP